MHCTSGAHIRTARKATPAASASGVSARSAAADTRPRCNYACTSTAVVGCKHMHDHNSGCTISINVSNSLGDLQHHASPNEAEAQMPLSHALAAQVHAASEVRLQELYALYLRTQHAGPGPGQHQVSWKYTAEQLVFTLVFTLRFDYVHTR